LIKLRN